MMWRKILWIVICLTGPTQVEAGNAGFLPGDSFFHTRLTEEACNTLLSQPSPRLPYWRPDWVEGAFCGYYGYMELELTSDNKPLFEHAQGVYRSVRQFEFKELVEIRSGTKIETWETNGLRLFIYNEDFSPLVNYVGLRYNESWVENLQAFGMPRKAVTLESFDTHPKAFSCDWRDAAEVPPLKIRVPSVEESLDAIRRGEAVAKCDGPIQFIVLDSDKFQSFVNPRQRMKFFSITNSGVKKYEYQKREWKVEDWHPERPDDTP